MTLGMSANNNDDKSQTEESKNQLHDSGFVSPANISLPLAKLIPILSAQVLFSNWFISLKSII